MKAVITITGCVLTAANFILFIILISQLSPIPPEGGALKSYDAISVQITILGVILGAVAIGLAAAAFFGYQTLETMMLRHADTLVTKRLENLGQAQPPESATPGSGPTPPAQVEEENTI